MRLTIDSVATLTDAPPEMLETAKRANRFRNPAYAEAMKHGRSTADIEETIRTYTHYRDGRLILPRGYAGQLLRDWPELLNHLQDERKTAPADVPALRGVTLRPYQQKALSGALRREQGLIEAPTGSGKTIVGLELIRRRGQRTLILTHSRELLNQWRAEIQRLMGIEAGQIGAGKWHEGDVFTVAMLQTLARHEERTRETAAGYGLALVDECFVASTEVDGRAISEYRIGDTVTAYDEETGAITQSPITHIFKRPAPERLFKVKAGSREVICTGNHPFLTGQGWIEAKNLTTEREVFLYGSSRNELQCMRHEVCAQQAAVGPTQRQARNGKYLLFKRLLNKIQTIAVIGNDGGNQQTLCQPTNEREQPHEESENPKEGFGHAPGDRTQADRSGWKRAWIDCAARVIERISRMGAGIYSCHTAARGHAESLQAGPCGRQSEGLYRDRRRLSSSNRTPKEGQEKRAIPERKRVDSVTVYQQGRDSEYNALCPDGRVYNLEVERQHTYVANGFVVHNCHHIPAATFAKVISWMPCRYRYGLTATPHRRDGLHTLIHRQIGDTLAKITTREVQEVGGIVPAKVTVHHTGFDPGDVNGWTAFLDSLSRDDGRNQQIIDLAAGLAEESNTLILTDRVDHAERLGELAEDAGLRCVVVHGRLSTSDRKAALAAVHHLPLTIGTTGMLGEGLDVSSWGGLVLSMPISGRVRLLQAIGRIIRPDDGKTHGRIIDLKDDHALAGASVNKRRAIYSERGYPVAFDDTRAPVGGWEP